MRVFREKAKWLCNERKKPGWNEPAGFVKKEAHQILVAITTNVAVVAFGTEFRWEFLESFVHVHFDAVVLAAFFVGWLEGAAVGWAGEGDELVEAVAEAFECAVGAVDCSVAPASFCTVGIRSADHHFRDFNYTIKNIAECTTELAGGGVMGARRRLDISCCEA